LTAPLLPLASVVDTGRPAPEKNRRLPRAGFTINQALLTLIALVVAGWWTYHYLQQRALAEQAVNNLRLVYMALEMYEIDRGRLPDLAFFPDDPRHDNDSPLVVLAKYGGTEELMVCPTAPPALKELGLNYVWNTQLNGRKLHEPGQRDWMFVELHALSSQVPPPHLGHYTILYTDGKVERSRVPPPDLRVP